MRKAALAVSGVIFAAMAIMHFVRYAKGWEIVAGGFMVPLDWSIYAGIVAAVLAIWMFAAIRR